MKNPVKLTDIAPEKVPKPNRKGSIPTIHFQGKLAVSLGRKSPTIPTFPRWPP